MRRTLREFAASRSSNVLGLCEGNLPSLASYTNEAIERLLNCFSETGFYGCWAKAVFSVSRVSPYITLPAQFSRAVNMDVCRTPIRIQNQFYDVLVDGIGLQSICNDRCGVRAAYDRGNIPTSVDLPPANQLIRVYYTDSRDIGARIFFAGALDANGNGIYSQDGVNTANGFFLTLAAPFVTSAFVVTSFAQVSKPVTFGDIVLKAVDATSGVETILSRYTPKETNPSYRRYYLHALPCGCCACPVTPGNVQITAMLKYAFYPVSEPTDYLLCGCFPALKKEVMSIRHEEMDDPRAKQLGIEEHAEAVRLLNQELASEMGTEFPAIAVAMPWGNYRHDPMRVGWGGI